MADLRAKWKQVKEEGAERKRKKREKSGATMGLIAVNEGRRGKRVV